MTGFYDAAIGGSAALEAQGTEAIPEPAGEVLGAAAAERLAHAFQTAEIGRANVELGVDPNSGMPIPQGHMLSPEEANSSYGIEGRLKWSAPVPEDVAQEQQRRKRETILNEDIIARRDSGIMTGGVARFAAGIVGGLPGIVDPVNLAASFIPGVGEMRAAIWAAKAGIAGRAAAGAVQGAAGMAALVPLQYGLARSEQEDYGATDALLNIALGGIFGGGLHALVGRAPSPEASRTAQAIEQASPEAREALLRGSIADLAEGRPVTAPAEIADRTGLYLDNAGVPRATTPYDRVPKEPERLASFLQRQGGLKDEGGELRAREIARPGLRNAGGISLDEATLRAWQDGFLPGDERPDINTLLEALDRDLGGHPVYREQDEFSAAEYRDAAEHNSEIDRLAQEHGIPLAGKSQAEFYQAVSDKLGEAGAAAEAERLAARGDDIMARADAEGWLPDFGERAPGGTPEEIENAYRQETVARSAGPGAGGAPEPATVRGAAGADETGLGRGGRGAGAGRRGEPPAGISAGRAAELTAEDARPPLDRLNEEIATLEREIAQALPEGERPAELEAADRLAADAETVARTIEQGGICLGRRL